MPTSDSKPDLHGGTVHIPRSRGALSGLLLVIFGAWAAIIPFIGPLFSYAYTPDKSWTWTAPRGWLEVLPGAVALLAGVILLVSANRVTASLAAWLGIAAGAWLVIGRDLAAWLHIGSPGQPASSRAFLAMLESIGLFSGIGAAILFVAAVALGRLSIRSVRDVRAAQRQERKSDAERDKISESAYSAGRRDEAADQRRTNDPDHTEDEGQPSLVQRVTHPRRNSGGTTTADTTDGTRANGATSAENFRHGD